MPYKDPERQKKAQREYASRKRESNKAYVLVRKAQVCAYVRSKKTDPCVDCGETFPVVCMDFDHVRGEKLFNLSNMHNRMHKLSRIDEEIAKCDLVCANCHRIRTADRGGWNPDAISTQSVIGDAPVL